MAENQSEGVSVTGMERVFGVSCMVTEDVGINALDRAGLGNFVNLVVQPANENSPEKLRRSRTGEDYTQAEPEDRNLFDKLHDFLGTLLPYLDHETRVKVMTLSKAIFTSCRPAICYLASDRLHDSARFEPTVRNLCYQNEQPRMPREEREKQIKNDLIKVCRFYKTPNNFDHASLSIVQVQGTVDCLMSPRSMEKTQQHSLKQHGYLVALMLRMVALQEQVLKRRRQLTKDKIAKIRSMQHTNTTQELRGDLIIDKNYPVQYIAGIKVIEFVNLPALTPALLQVSGLREFPSLSEVCIYNCLQFSRDKVHLLVPTIRVAIEKAHGVSGDDGGNGVIVDWSICRPAQDGSFLNESDIFKAWLCFLYRGAKKLRDVSVATNMDPVCLAELAQDCAATDGVSEIAAAYDLSCIWLWKSFASPLMRDHTDCPTQIQVLQRRLWSLCVRCCRDEPFRTTKEHLSFWHDLLQLRYETALVSPDNVAMQAIEDAAINIDGLKRTQTRTFDDLSPRMKCHSCKHENLPAVFFSKANVRDFKKGRDKIFTCRGCVYDQDVADFTKRQFAIAGTLQKLEKYLRAPNINSIQEVANEFVQITPVEKSGK